MEEAAKILEIVDFTSRVDTSTEPSHYVIFWEVNGDASDQVLQDCCNCLDRSFANGGYGRSRQTSCIGPLELRIVRNGTFHLILDHYVGLGAVVSQFKIPGCVGPSNNTVFQILSSNVSKSYFSTAY